MGCPFSNVRPAYPKTRTKENAATGGKENAATGGKENAATGGKENGQDHR
ncbi:MAG: hypothetical protein PW788_04850 [Micavibrio sp.]|nr:hypothetical protein [Micavibrio sp.]